MEVKTRVFGKMSLDCFAVPQPRPGFVVLPQNLCIDPKTNVLLAELDDAGATITRNSLASFQGTVIPLELHILYVGRLAISGKVVESQTFNQAESNITLSAPSV